MVNSEAMTAVSAMAAVDVNKIFFFQCNFIGQARIKRIFFQKNFERGIIVVLSTIVMLDCFINMITYAVDLFRPTAMRNSTIK